jgi:hypothetical protein
MQLPRCRVACRDQSSSSHRPTIRGRHVSLGLDNNYILLAGFQEAVAVSREKFGT